MTPLNLIPPAHCRRCGVRLRKKQTVFCSRDCSAKSLSHYTIGREVEEEILARYYAGTPTKDVAAGLPRGCESTLFNVLRRRGLPLRSRLKPA